MHKELTTIKIIKDYLETNGYLNKDIKTVKDIYEQISNIMNIDNRNIKKFNSLYILNYIKLYIANEDVAKRKTSARVVEDLLAILFNGEVTDNKSRKNILFDVPDCFENAKDKLAGNKREKIDIIFRQNNELGFGISVKTLMFNNYEINMGSFERQVLFDGFGISTYLKERKSEDKATNKKGLGSSAQLKNLLEHIKINNQYEKFKNRFINMFNYVFNDDLLILIKDNSFVNIYFILGEDLCKYFEKATDNIDKLTSIINRWEGNSIRIDRRPLLKECDHLKITLDLSVLDNSVIKYINEFDHSLHQSYVSYFNQKTDNTYQKNRQDIIKELDMIFDQFDLNFGELCV